MSYNLNKMSLPIENSGDKNLPLYRSIKNLLWRQIRTGELLIGDKMPSENKLAAELGVSRITIRRAFRELQTEGVIRRVKGLGTFVADSANRLFNLQFPDISDYIISKGWQHEKEILVFEQDTPGPSVKKCLELEDGETVFRLSLIQKANGLPIAHEDRFAVSHLFPDFIEQDFTKTSYIDYFLKRAVLERVEHKISALAAEAPLTKYLQIEKNAPCMYLERITYSFGRAATFSKITLPGKHFIWESEIDLRW